MANRFLESVGEVDVVSDSENIKKLLKIPFAGNQSTISMMVHRVGRTLLIDDFDLSSLALQEHEFQWNWLRKLIYEVLVLSKSQLEVPSKIESSRVQTMRMFEQFLRHSLSLVPPSSNSTKSPHECEGDFLHLVEAVCDRQEQKAKPYTPGGHVSSTSLDLIPASSKEISELRRNTSDSLLTTTSPLQENLEFSLDFFERQLDHIDDIYSVGKKERQVFEEEVTSSEGGKTEQEFLLQEEDKLSSPTQPNRNLFWKFEDIKMLLGSEMPIFGDQTHPAVSLRLHEMTAPINVLTGLDYWLDNLMCSVPEVIMCYHLDGIVQKYESIKTEDIPNISSSSFSPFVVRNIAQNILTFLKSKATKSGHTYWLFKGKNDDVVKLYDLTSLYLDHNVVPSPSKNPCESSNTFTSSEERNESTSQPDRGTDSDNPYLIPVAMLLYRVAKNVKESSIGSSSSPQRDRTVYKLLENCIRLLGLCTSKSHSMVVQVSISARYLMAQLLCPDLEESLKRSSSSASSEDQDLFFQDDEEEIDEKTEVDDSSSNYTDAKGKYISALNVNTLCEFPKKERDTSLLRTNRPYDHQQSKCLIDTSDPREKLVRCSQYLLDGIDLLSREKGKTRLSPRKQTVSGEGGGEEEVMREAKPFEPIPMKFKSDVGTDIEMKAASSQVMAMNEELKREQQDNDSWFNSQMKLFTTKLCQVLYSMIDLCLERKQYYHSLSLIQSAFSLLEFASSFGSSISNSIELSLLVSLAADMNILNNSWSACHPGSEDSDEELESLLDRINDILVRTSIDPSGKYYDIYLKIYSNSECTREDILCESIKLYEQSLNCLKSLKRERRDFIDLKIIEVTKKYGNACNELGCLYMNQATQLYSDARIVDKSLFENLESVTKKSLSCFVKGVTSFDSINDPINSSFLYSNTGKLMRVCAHVFAPVNESKERSSEFNMKENHLYSKSVHYYSMALSKLDFTSPSIVTELKGTIMWDLSTTLFTWGCLMQDFPPLNIKAYESIEKQIQDCMIRSLELVNKFLTEKSTQNSSSDDPRLVLFKFRAANILSKLASLFHHTFRNMSAMEPKRKQVFITSDDYYQQCSDIFMQLHSSSVSKEFLESCLERIALHEHNLSNLNGIASKMKAVNNLFLIFRSISAFLRNTLEQDANEPLLEKEEIDVQSIQKLVYLLIQRFEVNVEAMLKLVTGKSMKKSANQKKDKEKWESIRKKLQGFEMLKAIETKKVQNNENGEKNWLKSTIESFCEMCELNE